MHKFQMQNDLHALSGKQDWSLEIKCRALYINVEVIKQYEKNVLAVSGSSNVAALVQL